MRPFSIFKDGNAIAKWRMDAHNSLFAIVLFLALVILIWAAFFSIPAPIEVRLSDISIQDLSHDDFSNTIYSSSHGWESYPEKLYTPAEFDIGDIADRSMKQDEMDYTLTQYATHRMRFTLPPGKTYGLLMKSADYSMRIFIDGIEIDSVGVPGDTRETTVPRTLKRTYYFVTQSGVVDVVVQAANFVHREGAYPPKFFIGSASMITNKADGDTFKSCALIFCLITAFLYHFGLFLMNRRRKAALLFSICCLLLSFLNYKTVLDFFPAYNWFFAIRFEYINHYLIFAALAMFLETLHPILLHRIIIRIFYAITGLYVIITVFFDPRTFTLLLYGFETAAALIALYILIRLAINMKDKKAQSALTFVGTLVVALLGFFVILIKLQLFWIENTSGLEFATPIGMVFMVFCYALAVALDYAETERAYAEAQQKIAEIQSRLDAQEKMSPMGSFVKLSDLSLSPRETDIAMLLLCGKTREEICKLLFLSAGSVNTYCTRIYKKAGCSSRAELMRLLNYEI